MVISTEREDGDWLRGWNRKVAAGEGGAMSGLVFLICCRCSCLALVSMLLVIGTFAVGVTSFCCSTCLVTFSV